MAHPHDTHETVGAALVTVVQAGQQLLADRLDLALVEGHKMLRGFVVELVLLLFGALMLLGALIVADVALVDRLRRSDSGSAALLYCALAHGVIGAVLLLAVAWRRRAGKVER